MNIQILKENFSVCQVSDISAADLSVPFTFAAVTDSELSLVCPSEYAPQNITAREDGWRAMRITGVLDFSLIGILAEIASLLAKANISIFALSTYNTDYILVKDKSLARAADVLKNNGYIFDF